MNVLTTAEVIELVLELILHMTGNRTTTSLSHFTDNYRISLDLLLDPKNEPDFTEDLNN